MKPVLVLLTFWALLSPVRADESWFQDPPNQRTFHVRYMEPQNVLEVFSRYSGLKCNLEGSTITAVGPPRSLDGIASLLDQYDHPARPVIGVKLMSLEENERFEALRLKGFGGITFSMTSPRHVPDFVDNRLTGIRKAPPIHKILSPPWLTYVESWEPAGSGEIFKERAFGLFGVITYGDAFGGFRIELTPEVKWDDSIIIDCRIEKWRTTENGEQVQGMVSTSVRVRSEDVLEIGGLIETPTYVLDRRVIVVRIRPFLAGDSG